MNKKFLLFSLFIVINQYAAWRHGDIHIIGDSHSVYSFTNIHLDHLPPMPPFSDWPLTYEKSFFNYKTYNELLSIQFQIHWINLTMHTLSQGGFNTLDFKTYDIKDNDIVLLTFGGIDAYHGSIMRQYLKGRDLYEIIETLTQSYIKSISANRKLYDKLTIIVMAVISPWMQQALKNDFIKQETKISFEEFIVLVNRTLNAFLERHCKNNNLLYFNVNNLFEDPQGILRADLSCGDHHIQPRYNYLIKENLIKLILEKM